MKITALQIENFRAIRFLELSELPDAVVIAGPNGSGKSCVVDALRLLKSAYGEYNTNEWQKCFTEFSINIQKAETDAVRILQDPTRSLRICATIAISRSEKEYIEANAHSMTEGLAWNRVLPHVAGLPIDRPAIPPTERHTHGATMQTEKDQILATLYEELKEPHISGELTMTPKGELNYRPSALLELVFRTYDPHNVGIIDYHSAHRSYPRENVASVNLSVTENADRSKQSALYDTQNKYANIKIQMASAYIRDLIAEKSGLENDEPSGMIETLKELFKTFFPGKTFLGPQPTPDGRLLFQVELANGIRHDIDDLSSGEKEVLLGYLRLRNSSPSNSVIVLDEPELHLNPRLTRGLVKFYKRHIGQALNNQLWLVTHSDTLLREAVEEPDFAVFHMQSISAVEVVSNQATRISVSRKGVSATDLLENAVMDLVGDLATYSPQAQIVILEGGGESETDVNIIRKLFPEFAERVNLISGRSKSSVRHLHELLEETAGNGLLNTRFFSIVDQDTEEPQSKLIPNRFRWDVYHIENYLLDEKYIAAAINSINLKQKQVTADQVSIALELSAKETLNELVRIIMERDVNSQLMKCINASVNPKGKEIALDFYKAAERSSNRIRVELEGPLALASLEKREAETRTRLEKALSSGEWKAVMRGRNVLRRLKDRLGVDVNYAAFHSLIVNEMSRDSFKPAGMAQVINQISSPPQKGDPN